MLGATCPHPAHDRQQIHIQAKRNHGGQQPVRRTAWEGPHGNATPSQLIIKASPLVTKPPRDTSGHCPLGIPSAPGLRDKYRAAPLQAADAHGPVLSYNINKPVGPASKEPALSVQTQMSPLLCISHSLVSSSFKGSCSPLATVKTQVQDQRPMLRAAYRKTQQAQP